MSTNSRTADELINELRDSDIAVRRAAANDLGKFKNDETIEKIGAILKYGNKDECNAALEALFNINNAYALKIIFAELKSLMRFDPINISFQLGFRLDLVVKSAINFLVIDENEDVCSGAIEALRLLQRTDRKAVENTIGSLDDDVRRKVEAALN